MCGCWAVHCVHCYVSVSVYYRLSDCCYWDRCCRNWIMNESFSLLVLYGHNAHAGDRMCIFLAKFYTHTYMYTCVHSPSNRIDLRIHIHIYLQTYIYLCVCSYVYPHIGPGLVMWFAGYTLHPVLNTVGMCVYVSIFGVCLRVAYFSLHRLIGI